MEAATAYWSLDDLVGHIVEVVVRTGQPPNAVIDEMWPIRLKPDDQALVLREGIRSIVNGQTGMRRVRSGGIQSVRGTVRPLAEEPTSIIELADRLLDRLHFAGADGGMRSVLDFNRDDAENALQLRVHRLREVADREEPFWRALVAATAKGRTLRRQKVRERQRFAALAIDAGLTKDEPEADED